jgi:glycerol uptake facilitator-like aquaporin
MKTKPFLAEFIGTFTLIFIGAGAGALAGSNGGGIVAVALAHGVALMVIVYAWGSVSGAHVNPAVTFSLAISGKTSWGDAIQYWIAQFLGAALGGFVLRFVIGTTGNLGMTLPAESISGLQAVVLEAVLTFFLLTAVFGTAVANRNGNAAGLAIGFVLTMDILMGGALTGPLVGGAVAALVYDRLILDK